MKKGTKDGLEVVGSTAVGGAVGAGIHGIIGGVGVTAIGTGVGITLAPFIAIGAGAGFALYGAFWLGRQIGSKSKKE